MAEPLTSRAGHRFAAVLRLELVEDLAPSFGELGERVPPEALTMLVDALAAEGLDRCSWLAASTTPAALLTGR